MRKVGLGTEGRTITWLGRVEEVEQKMTMTKRGFSPNNRGGNGAAVKLRNRRRKQRLSPRLWAIVHHEGR